MLQTLMLSLASVIIDMGGKSHFGFLFLYSKHLLLLFLRGINNQFIFFYSIISFKKSWESRQWDIQWSRQIGDVTLMVSALQNCTI